MTATITFYPLGDADSSLIELADKRIILIDYGNEGKPGSIDLPRALRAKLKIIQRDYFDAVVFTHFDRDHTLAQATSFGSTTRPRTRERTESKSRSYGSRLPGSTKPAWMIAHV
jgi:glyoxylase-like metal-dependent hydrolase (beta-lactamase superfamily II)